MKKIFKAILTVVAIAGAVPAAAQEDPVTAQVIEENDGTRTLVHEAVIDAPVAAVWATLSTAEGWKSWGPKFARFDLRHGGAIETGYHDGAAPGDQNNIVHRILAFVPERMMVIQVTQAPENGPVDIAAVKRVWGVYELEPMGENRTRMRISGVGYGKDEASAKILEFFKSGNIYSINMLRQNLVKQDAAYND